MAIRELFPTRLYTASLRSGDWRKWNSRLLRECLQLRIDDTSGVRWSRRNYPGGYTSYHSAHRMHTVSPTFARLERLMRRHVAIFADSLDFDLEGRELAMTDCWVNIMPRQVAHSLHLHPLSTLSGTYYVRTPRGCPGLKFEDPRLDRYMAAPPRKADCRAANRAWISVDADAGNAVLFESWLRHEVAPNAAKGERVSISFNYGWF